MTGRVLDFESEVIPVAAERLSNTFKIVDGRKCFYGVCYYCNEEEYACGKFLNYFTDTIKMVLKIVDFRLFSSF